MKYKILPILVMVIGASGCSSTQPKTGETFNNSDYVCEKYSYKLPWCSKPTTALQTADEKATLLEFLGFGQPPKDDEGVLEWREEVVAKRDLQESLQEPMTDRWSTYIDYGGYYNDEWYNATYRYPYWLN